VLQCSAESLDDFAKTAFREMFVCFFAPG